MPNVATGKPQTISYPHPGSHPRRDDDYAVDPHVVVLSTLHPVGPQETMNIVEFYYPEDIAAFEREFVQAQRAAYMETAIEDDEIAERMDAGRKALMLRGTNETGPYQSPMEDGMMHFHEWYRRLMDTGR